MLEQLKKNYIFAVIRGKDEEDAKNIARFAVKGGIKNIELTFSTPNTETVITDLKNEFAEDKSVIIGAGTVMTSELALKAIEAGAEFLVSPHYDEDIQKLSLLTGVEYFPGCSSVTEIVAAKNAGAKIIKVFPGGIFGPSFIKDVHGPIPDVELMPSGGVSLANIAEWKSKGACAVGVGSALSAEISEKGYESVTELASEFVNALK
ncbi:MAG: bifunctional 4-hydroxy-2-oxoglutarate aldolase/2-dehydro-3-deoxy-phosphogluconate aldolase [Streptococcus sp.]|nr:bifunctional 4-hydroxy-2-oxoglutarate aldolase/2-dehydro-3-deoxy-phosphogluconate aldolase [Streptococcus sp.]